MKLSTILRRMRKNRMFMMGTIILVIMILACATSSLWLYHDPEVGNLIDRHLKPDFFANGLKGHPFGTDAVGRDLLSRLFAGGWVSLKISFMVTMIAMVAGAFIGLIAGYFGGVIDMILMRVSDLLAAMPQLLMAICVIAILGNGMGVLIFTLTATSWIQTARLVRSQVLGMKNKEFVSASRVLGAKTSRILWKELFPNTITQMMIAASGHFGGTILVETSLSYLGMGIAPPTPSWGNMISDGRAYLGNAPWVVIFPGIALALTVLGFNFLGDGIRDVFDPKNVD